MTDFLALIRTRSLDRVSGDFLLYAHPHQEPPLVTRGGRPWRTWLVLGGRGAGKTRAGAEWVAEQIRAGCAKRVALIAATKRTKEALLLIVDLGAGIVAEHLDGPGSGRRCALAWFASNRAGLHIVMALFLDRVGMRGRPALCRVRPLGPYIPIRATSPNTVSPERVADSLIDERGPTSPNVSGRS